MTNIAGDAVDHVDATCVHVDRADSGPVHQGRAQRWALASIEWYQRMAAGRLSPCRFHPSCSAYAHEAYEVHGARRGSALTIRRLVRCRPFGPSGFDPVPELADRRAETLSRDGVVGDITPAHKDC